MSPEQKQDFNKLKEVLRRIPGEFTPQQLGSLFSQYAIKWLNAPKHEDSYTDILAPLDTML